MPPIWQEALFGIEVLLLHASPVYYGYGVPRGDDSAVVIIPGFLAGDFYLVDLCTWLRRIGYRPYLSGIGANADCPNLLIRYRLLETLEKARRETGRKVHLLGHSLGGLLARAIAADRPRDVASVITLGSPFRGAVVHPRIQGLVDRVRQRILETRRGSVLPSCYTGACTCSFLDSLRRDRLPGVRETAIYSSVDGVVDWRFCRTGDSAQDFEVTATHIGLAFHPEVYRIVARRLAACPARKPRITRPRPLASP